MSAKTTYDAPVMFYDHPPDGDPVWPCDDCLPWHVEVLIDPDGSPRIRQWHAIGCRIWISTEHEEDRNG